MKNDTTFNRIKAGYERVGSKVYVGQLFVTGRGMSHLVSITGMTSSLLHFRQCDSNTMSV